MADNRQQLLEPSFRSRGEKLSFLANSFFCESEEEDFEGTNELGIANEEADSDTTSPAPSLTPSLDNLLDLIEQEEVNISGIDNTSITSNDLQATDGGVLIDDKDMNNGGATNNGKEMTTVLPHKQDTLEATDNSKEGPTSETRKKPSKRKKTTIYNSGKVIKKSKPNSMTLKKQALFKFNFKNQFFLGDADIPRDEFTTPPISKTAYEYFTLFFTESIMHMIVNNSNLYSVQKTGTCINLTRNDLSSFLAIELLMGVCDMPAYVDYWNESYGYDKVRKIMSLKQYKKIRSSLHFADNSASNNDRYYKIRPFLEAIRENFQKVENEKRQSIDEMMIPYKGTKAGNRRQYIKSKPKKWGFKVFVRAGVSGFVYDFLIYGGAETFQNETFLPKEDIMGIGAKVVLYLCKRIPEPVNSVIYFDNFFCSLELVHYLRSELGIFSLGTLRANRLRGTELPVQKKKAERGSFVQLCDNDKKISLVKWTDNKDVLLISSYVSVEPLGNVRRFSKAEGKKISIPCPRIVQEYNMHMGGVDLCDMLVALYRTSFRTKKWYMAIFSQMLDICINNAWLLMRRECELMTGVKDKTQLKQFRIQVAESLLLKGKMKPKRSSLENQPPLPSQYERIRAPSMPRPQTDIRFDGVGHFPKFESKGRCKFCKNGQTSVMCVKCELRLCFVPDRNCFYGFHCKE